MSSFSIYTLNGHELMPLNKVFKKSGAEKTQAIVAERPIDRMDYLKPFEQDEKNGRQHLAEQAYSTVKQLPQNPLILLAEQIMTSPVVTLTPGARISKALNQFQTHGFRHIPVVSSAGRLVGIVSDRDILRYMAGLSESYQRQTAHTSDEQVEQLMTPHVLTASIDTDVRYIARLFVEQHIGAMPVAAEGELKGIITRGDVLRAVMRHYSLELWV